MLICDGFLGASCIVQEWVDFDFEMRLFFFPPSKWEPSTRLAPKRLECNMWGDWDVDEGKPGYFFHASREACLARWYNDEAAFKSAEEKAVDISQSLLKWLCSKARETVPMVRLDFMARRL